MGASGLHARRVPLAVAAALVAGIGCERGPGKVDLDDTETADDTSVGDDTDTSGDTDTSDTSDTGDTGTTCTGDRTGFAPAGGEVVTYFAPLDGLLYEGLSGSADPIDVLRIELYYGASVPAGAHTFSFAGENYAACSVCALAMAGCTQGAGCDKTFLADTGRLVVTENGGSTGTFAAELQDARFVEVTIAAGSYVSTPVDGGESWCLHGVPLQGTIGSAR